MTAILTIHMETPSVCDVALDFTWMCCYVVELPNLRVISCRKTGHIAWMEMMLGITVFIKGACLPMCIKGANQLNHSEYPWKSTSWICFILWTTHPCLQDQVKWGLLSYFCVLFIDLVDLYPAFCSSTTVPYSYPWGALDWRKVTSPKLFNFNLIY